MTGKASFWSKPIHNTLSRVATGIGRFVSKYDANWIVKFRKIAQGEDDTTGMRISDPYRQIAWVNIAVERIASNIARAHWKLRSGDTEIEAGPVHKLFTFVNPHMSRFQLWKSTAAWMKTRGEAFWLFPPDKVGIPEAVYVVPPQTMTHKLDKSTGAITLWEYEPGGQGDKIPYLPDQLVHFNTWNPWDPYRGVNPLIAADYELAMEQQANISNLNILRNGSIPQGVLSSEQFLSEDQARETKERWLMEHRGANKSHSVAVLGQGTTYTSIQLSPQEMEYFEMKRWSRATILASYGIPPVLAGVTDERSPLSGSDTAYQLKNFWNQTLIPLMHLIEDKVQTDFFDRYGLKMEGKFDLSEIAELQEDEELRRARIRADVTAGILTINEAREELERDPVEWGDTWWISFGMVPALSRTESAPAEEALPEERTPIDSLFAVKQSRSPWTPLLREMHWKTVAQDWDKVEREYQKALEKWGFTQRSYWLRLIATEKSAKAAEEWIDAAHDDAYWQTQRKELEVISRKAFMDTLLLTDKHVRQLFESVGIDIGIDWAIVNTSAIKWIDLRVTNIGGVVDTVRAHVGDAIETALKEGLSQAETAKLIQEKYNIIQNRAPTIARTEIGNVVSDSRDEAFKSLGIEETEWVTARDGERVRVSHRIDGQRRAFGTPFILADGRPILRPHDPDAIPENTINCRCIVVPVPKE